MILSDGDFPTAAAAQSVLRHAQRVVCCDGAAEELLRRGVVPDAIVGDMDSLDPVLQERYADIIVRDTEQETNDLCKAFRYVLTLEPTEITILGASGGREDHTLGNISHLIDFTAQAPCPVRIVTDTGRFEAAHDSATFHCQEGTQISIFAFDPGLKIKSAGLKYPTDSVVFDALWKATLNEASSSTVTLTFNHPSGVLVFFADDLKHIIDHSVQVPFR